MPPSPWLSARMMNTTYLSDTTMSATRRSATARRAHARVESQRMRAGEAFLQRVQRAGADVAEDDADGAEDEGAKGSRSRWMPTEGCAATLGMSVPPRI